MTTTPCGGHEQPCGHAVGEKQQRAADVARGAGPRMGERGPGGRGISCAMQHAPSTATCRRAHLSLSRHMPQGTAPTLLAAALLLASCGNPVGRSGPRPRTPASAADSTPCSSVSTLDRLVVRRSNSFPQNHMRTQSTRQPEKRWPCRL